MKRLFTSYTSFTRTEKMGLAALAGVLVVLLALNIILRYTVKPRQDNAAALSFITAWEHFKNKATEDTTAATQTSTESAAIPATAPGVFNLNNADSVTLLSLKGIGPVTAHKILDWRRNNGPFTSYGQLKPLGRFSAATFDTLKTHLSLSPAR